MDMFMCSNTCRSVCFFYRIGQGTASDELKLPSKRNSIWKHIIHWKTFAFSLSAGGLAMTATRFAHLCPFTKELSFASLFNQRRSDFYLNASLRLLDFFFPLRGKKWEEEKKSISDAINSEDWPLVLCRLPLTGHLFDALGVRVFLSPSFPF